MPHQDKIDGTNNAELLKEVLTQLVLEDAFSDLDFQRDSHWKPMSLVFAALLWTWSDEESLTKRFGQATKILVRWAIFSTIGQTYQGFTKRLHCWNEKLRERVKKAFRRRMLDMLEAYLLVDGWLVLAADGSRCATPRTASNEARFAPKKPKKPSRKGAKGQPKGSKQKRSRRRKKQASADREKKASTPQIWITVLYAVGLDLPWDWRQGPSNSSEREHLLEMVQDEDLPPQALITMDAGFVGYEFWQQLCTANVPFVGRVGANVKLLKNLGYVRRGEDIVHVWPDHAQRKKQPPLELRLKCFSDGKEQVYLVTNVLDEKRLSDKQMLAIYAARWGVELYYRDFKQTFKRAKLRSHSPQNAELELDWSLMGLWAMNLHASLEHAAAGIAPKRRSVANVLSAFRMTMKEYKSPPDPGEDLGTLLQSALKDEYVRTSSKASRNASRKKTKHAISAPTLNDATAAQIRIAHEIKTTYTHAA